MLLNLNRAFKNRLNGTLQPDLIEKFILSLQINGKQATVDMNGISFQTPLDSVYECKTAAPKEESIVRIASTAKPKAEGKAAFELMLRGLTFDEAQPLIDEFLDSAVLAGLHRLRIIHGKGTGILRSKTRDYLRRNRQIISMETPPPSEGGTGVTVVTI